MEDMDTMLRDDLTNQAADIKDVVYDLNKVLQLGYDVLVMKEDSTIKKDMCVCFIGLATYVTSKLNDEMGILMDLIDTM